MFFFQDLLLHGNSSNGGQSRHVLSSDSMNFWDHPWNCFNLRKTKKVPGRNRGAGLLIDIQYPDANTDRLKI